jgi:hypothetical protein
MAYCRPSCGARGLALAPLEAQLTPTTIIPFLSELGLHFPPALLTQSSFMAAVNAGSTAAGALPAQLTKLTSDITAGTTSPWSRFSSPKAVTANTAQNSRLTAAQTSTSIAPPIGGTSGALHDFGPVSQ